MAYVPYRPPQPLDVEPDLIGSFMRSYAQAQQMNAQKQEMARRQAEDQRRAEMLQMERQEQARRQQQHELAVDEAKIRLQDAKLQQKATAYEQAHKFGYVWKRPLNAVPSHFVPKDNA